MNEIYVDENVDNGDEGWGVYLANGPHEFDTWLATFRNKEDAHDYADLMRLRP